MEEMRRAWRQPPPGRLIGKGHPAGDFLEAWKWEVLEEREGFVDVLAHIPDHARNPRGQLFGGFTPTFVDLLALLTIRTGPKGRQQGGWLATTSMKIDYLAPVIGPRFRLTSELVHRRKRSNLVETRFFDLDDQLLVLAITTMLEVKPKSPLGDA